MRDRAMALARGALALLLGSSLALPLSAYRSRSHGAEATALDIPAFARKYRTSCSTCHTAAPKLNVLGEAFRLNGYRFPDNDLLLRKEEPVPLGAEPWKDQWPRAIWPGELPAIPPVALRIVNDAQVTAEDTAGARWTYRFPNEVYLLAGGSLGSAIGFFLEMEWTPDDGFEVIQAKVPFQNAVPFLPDRLLNLWVGKQNLYLFTLGDRQIDRAARQRFLWMEFDPSQLALLDTETGEEVRSENDLRLRSAQPALEANGLIGGRAYYALGLSQGSVAFGTDNNTAKDFYYKLRYKLGGLALDGTYDADRGPVLGTGGQLFDRGLVLEHFGYLGKHPVAGEAQDVHRTFGVAARWLYGTLDLGAGWVWGENRNPWGLDPPIRLTHWSGFSKLEYFIYPWLIASLKADLLRADIPEGARSAGFGGSPLDQTRVLPGVVVLLRQNVRGVIEGELFTEHEPAAAAGRGKPHNLWFRLDIAF